MGLSVGISLALIDQLFIITDYLCLSREDTLAVKKKV